MKLSPAPPRIPLAGVVAATCDPASPLDLHGQEFAVYDNGHTIMAPDPYSAVDYEPNATSTRPVPGSTVGVTGVDNGQTVPSSASYSFPLGEMDLRALWTGRASRTAPRTIHHLAGWSGQKTTAITRSPSTRPTPQTP